MRSIARAIIAVCAMVMVQDHAWPQVPEHLAYPKGFKPIAGGFYLLPICKPIAPEDFEAMLESLNAAPSQREAQRKDFDEFRRADWAFRMEFVQPLYDRSGEFARRGIKRIMPEIASEQVAIFRDAEKVIEPLTAIEQTFLDEVAERLGVSGSSQWKIILRSRERIRDRAAGSMFPAFAFDLDATFNDLDREGLETAPINPESFARVMDGWREEAGRLYRDHVALWTEAMIAYVPLQAEANASEGKNDDRAAVEKFYDQIAEKRRAVTAAERRLHDVHCEAVGKLVGLLPPATGDALLAKFQQMAYQPLFPDPCELKGVWKAFDMLEMQPEQRKALGRIQNDAQSRVDALLQKMIASYLKWNEYWCARQSIVYWEYSRYNIAMLKDSDERIAICRATVDAAMNTLTKAQRLEVADAVRRWRESIEVYVAGRDAINKDNGGWPNRYR